MLAAALAVLGLLPAEPAAEPVPLRWDGMKETLASYLVRHGMTQAEVERVMGDPFAVDSFGPPGDAHVVYGYLGSGVNVTFGPGGRVRGVSGGYWRLILLRGPK